MYRILHALQCFLFLMGIVFIGSCSQEKTLQPLRIGITTWPGFDIALYGEASGIFKRRGLAVKFLRFQNQQDSLRAVMRGDLDAAFVSLWDVTQVEPRQNSPTLIMVSNISHGADGIVAKAGIKTVKELRGKRVGAKLATVNHLILLEALQLHQIDPAEIQIKDISNEVAAQYMLDGQLEGAVLWDPLLGEIREKIKGHVVFTTREIDSLVIDTLTSSKTTVESKHEELIQFILGWFDIMHAVEKEPEQVFSAIAKVLGEEATSFANAYAGLKKGDIAMNQRLFKAQGRLAEALPLLKGLLEKDPRHGKLSRADIDIDGSLVNEAIQRWKPIN